MEDSLGFLQQLKFSTGEVTCCDINTNYLLAVGSSDSKLRVLEWKAGLGFVEMFYSPLDCHKYKITSVKFSPKGTMLASSSLDGTAMLFDVLTGNRIYTMVQHNKSNIKFCEFTFDCSKAITAADDGILCFWDLLHQKQIRYFRFLEDDCNLRSLSLSPDSQYMMSMDSTDLLKLWFVGDVYVNPPRCILLKREIHEDSYCCAFSREKDIAGGSVLAFKYSIVTCGGDRLIKVWHLIIQKDPKPGPEEFKCDLLLTKVLKHNGSDVINVRFNPSGNYIVSTGMDNLLKLYEVRTGKHLKTFPGHTGIVTCIAFSKDSLLLATGSIDNTLIVWDLSQNLTLDAHLMPPCNISRHFTHIDLTNYHIGREYNAEIIHPQKSELTPVQKLKSTSFINCIQFQNDDILAIAGGEKTVTLWKRRGDALTYELQEPFKKYKYSINDVDVSQCGRKIIFCSLDGAIILWNLNMDSTCELTAPSCTASLRTCRFLAGSQFIAAAGDDQEVYLWDANSLEFIKVIQKHENVVAALAFTPDGQYMASACIGGHIMLQHLNEGICSARINNAHDLGVTSCDFSPPEISKECTETYFKRSGGKVYLLATGGNDSLVKLWTVKHSEIVVLTVFSGHGGTVNFVKFSQSEPFILASCSSDTTVRIWHVKTAQCLHVLNFHKSAVTTCSFSSDSTLLATGSLDRTVLIFNTKGKFCNESTKWICHEGIKLLENWTNSDLSNWFMEMGWTEVANKISGIAEIDGRAILSAEINSVIDSLELRNEDEKKIIKQQVFCLKKEALNFSPDVGYKEMPPHMFLCPITHEVMKDPVICSDGFAYDRVALMEWFLSKKLISPVTKEYLKSIQFLDYSALKVNIYKFLYENKYHQ